MSKTQKPSRVAIIHAAAQGQGFASAIPKVLHPVLGKPMLRYAVSAAHAMGCDPVLITRPSAVRSAAIVEELGRYGTLIKAKGAGLGAALRAGLTHLGKGSGEVLVMPADMPLLEVDRLRELQRSKQAAKAALGALVGAQSGGCGGGGCGSCSCDDGDEDEAEDAELALPEGVQVMLCDRELLASVALGPASKRRRGDLVQQLLRHASDADRLVVEEVHPVELLQVESRVDLAMCTMRLRDAINQDHMYSGVTFDDPTTTLVEPTVSIGVDTTLGAGVQLRGDTVIHAGVVIEPYCVITDSEIEPGVRVRSFSHLEGAVVRSGAIVGPYSRLRPQADVGRNAHIGNFVEVKKSVIEEGAKANHLAYLGDARVGSGANVGAGTITCNYDGVDKHHTDIGQGVFIGSNSTLVAPIKIRDGAYVAAGSTLTQEVPADALAFGRARQENKPKLAQRLRQRMQSRAGAKKSGK